MNRSARRRNEELKDLNTKLRSIFTPGTPIDDSKLFSGRQGLLDELDGELGVTGVHIVLYGERGVGKTSLWRVLLEDRKVSWHSASAADDFVSIFLRVLEELGEQFTEDERTRLASTTASVGVPEVASVGATEGFEASESVVGSRTVDLNLVLDRVAAHPDDLDVIVIDEFQNISEVAIQSQIIEVVKGFSDRGLSIQMFLVGVADSDDELLSSPQYQRYKNRHFSASRVPRMTDDEIREILDLRENRFSVGLDDGVGEAIVRIASGYPAIAHRLALSAAQRWVVRAFKGYAVNFAITLLSFAVPIGGLSSLFTVEKAGIRVEDRDLREAVERFVAKFDSSNPGPAAAYQQIVASAERVFADRLIAILASSQATWVPADTVAQRLDLSAAALDDLVSSTSGLVERSDGGLRLKVRELLPYTQARQYLDQPASTA